MKTSELVKFLQRCDLCLQTTCDHGCPNEPDPPILFNCKACGAEIYEGDDYYEVDGEPYCDGCVRSRTAEVEED
jgi:hypothetical protein